MNLNFNVIFRSSLIDILIAVCFNSASFCFASAISLEVDALELSASFTFELYAASILAKASFLYSLNVLTALILAFPSLTALSTYSFVDDRSTFVFA